VTPWQAVCAEHSTRQSNPIGQSSVAFLHSFCDLHCRRQTPGVAPGTQPAISGHISVTGLETPHAQVPWSLQSSPGVVQSSVPAGNGVHPGDTPVLHAGHGPPLLEIDAPELELTVVLADDELPVPPAPPVFPELVDPDELVESVLLLDVDPAVPRSIAPYCSRPHEAVSEMPTEKITQSLKATGKSFMFNHPYYHNVERLSDKSATLLGLSCGWKMNFADCADLRGSVEGVNTLR